jgi:light-regulated signal transduction histidine kinase (bacteriophytochrome)
MSKGYENAPFLITKTIDKVMTSEIQLQDLVVYKFLHQDLDKYSSLFPHVAAAIQFSKAGWSSVKCANIQYIYKDAHHKNPLCRVTALELIRAEKELNYDKEKYREMLLEAAETLLAYFGFDRTVYGIDPEILPRLFTKFTKKSDKGTGLGLYISKRIIVAHGGRIWAENNTGGKGATFTFSLPLNN